MKINQRKVMLHTQGVRNGTIEFDGEKYVFDGLKHGEAELKRYVEQIREELGVENPTPEELFRYMVLRTYTNTNGALYVCGDGPEIRHKEFFREAMELKKRILAYARARKDGQQAQATQGASSTASAVENQGGRPAE